MRKKLTSVGSIRELLRIDLRENYRHIFFRIWEGRNLSAQHRFVPADDPTRVRMSFTESDPHTNSADVVLESADGGHTWERLDGYFPPCDRGLFRLGQLQMAVRGGMTAWITINGERWRPRRILSADELHFDGLGAPNCFSAIMLKQGLYMGRIVLVADYFLEQEGPDGQLLCAVYSDDWGESWHASRLFGVPEPLPKAPEGFGEPAVVQLPSGWLWMVFRTPYGELWQCISRDGGMSWSHPTPTGLSSPIANCYAAREPATGATVLCWNATRPGISLDFRNMHSLWRPRTNLVFAVSHDNTRTWTEPVVVEPEGGQYPTIHFAAGRMFVMYQSSPGTESISWHKLGLTLVAYDTGDVLRLPPWNIETIQPWITRGLVAPWRALACRVPGSKGTIS